MEQAGNMFVICLNEGTPDSLVSKLFDQVVGVARVPRGPGTSVGPREVAAPGGAVPVVVGEEG